MTTDTASHLRGARHDAGGRLRHGQGGRRHRSTRRPASARRTSTSSSCTTASRRTSCITYEALGLCPEGGAEKFIADGDNTYGGQFVTNPSGGLLSKGHPLGATGLAQCTELVAAAARQGRPAPGRRRAARAAAQPRPGRRLRRDAVRTAEAEAGHGAPMIDRRHIGMSAAPPPCSPSSAAGCASSPRRSARPTRSTPTRRPRAPPATRICRRRRPSCSPPSSMRRRSTAMLDELGIPLARCCTASRASPTTRRPAPATR